MLLERAHHLVELGARVLIHDPASSLDPAQARELVERVGEASGLPVGLHCQGAEGVGLAAAIEAVRAGPRRIAVALYPIALSLHRVSAEALTKSLAGVGLDTGVDLEVLWRASSWLTRRSATSRSRRCLRGSPCARPSTRLPAGLVAELEARLREHGSADRLGEVLEELTRIRRECGWPPLASPIGQVIGSQALLHVLSAQRWRFVVDELRDLVEGRYASCRGRRNRDAQSSSWATASSGLRSRRSSTSSARTRGLAASEEELLLLPCTATTRSRCSLGSLTWPA